MKKTVGEAHSRLITSDDLIETYCKIRQRGWNFIAKKFNLESKKRTLSAFNEDDIKAANWWIVPQVRKRWNEKITGDKNIPYEDYTFQKYLAEKTGLKMLSLGSGVCSHEIRFARFPAFSEVHCTDIAFTLLETARKRSQDLQLENMKFEVCDIYEKDFRPHYYDVVLFHSSLHHFKNIDSLIGNKIKPALKKGGLLIINEYIGPDRMQFPRKQVKAINEGLKILPPAYKRRYEVGFQKKHVSGPGLIRMILADPSECIESSEIIPLLHKHFEVLEEKPYGGNILMLLLKDIAHNFIEENEESKALLEELFTLEDSYLKNEKSDFLFGVYRKTE